MKKFLHVLNPLVSFVTLLVLAKVMVYHRTQSSDVIPMNYLGTVGSPWPHSDAFVGYTKLISVKALMYDWTVAVVTAGVVYFLLHRLNHRVHKSLPVKPATSV